MDDPGFWEWVKTPRSQGGGGLKSGDPIATETAYNELMRQYLRSSGSNFQPSAVAITNPVNTNQVVPFVTTSPNSVQPFPQERFKEGPIENGQQLVFDPQTGTYFPGTNTATRTVVQPQAKAPNRFELLQEELNRRNAGGAAEQGDSKFANVWNYITGGVKSSPAPTPAPTPEATPMPSPTPAAVTNAPAPAPTPAVFSAAQYQQMTGQQLPPGDYADANGRPFSIR